MGWRPCAIDGYQTIEDKDERDKGDEVGENKSFYCNDKFVFPIKRRKLDKHILILGR